MHRVANEEGKYTLKQVKEFLANQATHQLHKAVKKEFDYRIISTAPDELWEVDLVDLSDYKTQNKGTKYLMNVVDHFSKYAWSFPLKDKTDKSTSTAMAELLKEKKPKQVLTDQGKEFQGSFDELLDKEGVFHSWSQPYSPQTQGLVERFNQTLKRMIFRHFTETGKHEYISALPRFMRAYNNSVHRTIGMKPVQAEKNVGEAELHTLESLFNKKLTNAKFYEPGTRVRIIVEKDRFEKKYTPNWSNEIFTVVQRYPGLKYFQPDLYSVKDDNGKVLHKWFLYTDMVKVGMAEPKEVAKLQAFDKRMKVAKKVGREARVNKFEAKKIVKENVNTGGVVTRSMGMQLRSGKNVLRR